MMQAEQKCSVYVIEEKVQGTGFEAWNVVYVGSSIHVQDRWSEHNKPGFAGRPMTDALLAKGRDNFRCRVLGEYATKAFALEVENALMVAFDTFMPKGYNIKHPVHLPQVRQRNVTWTPERRAAQAERMRQTNMKRRGAK